MGIVDLDNSDAVNKPTTPYTALMTNHMMMPASHARSGSEVLNELSPFTVEFFLVQGVGFKCMAYPDAEGRWHEAFCNAELSEPIQVLE